MLAGDRPLALQRARKPRLRITLVSIYNHHMLRPSRPASSGELSTAVQGEPLIRFEDVYIGFDEGEVLRGVSFEVWPGETKVLLGESGSGKTLLMKLAAGLLRADAGRIWVMGHMIEEMPEDELLDFRRHLGFVFQEGALFDSMNVAENVAFRLREESRPEAEVDSRVLQALQFVEMESALQKYPAELSGGMRRRVSIARALIDRPPLVFYDSPTAGLDPVTSQTIITLILRGRDLQGVTSLLATHRVQDAFGLAHYRFDKAANRVVPANENGKHPVGQQEDSCPTNILMLRDGKVYFEGATEQMLHSSDDYLKTFLASAE